jgi:Flp pilus assembly protein TadG
MVAAQDCPMSSPAASTVTSRPLLRRFRRNRRGSAVVEFALVAPMFFALLFAIVETALMFLATQVLETITQDAARAVFTGQAQSGGVVSCQVGGQSSPCTQTSFQSYLCSKIPALFNCSGIYVDVQSYNSFSAITINSQISGGAFVNTMQYNPGGPGDIVVVRVFYQWPLFVTGLGYNIANLSGNQRLLVATAAFQNEPY